ncbi:unnamed protein product [Schistosoma turkestanicum]|nr:unnamed protein product [Schistosoma turkestanicum]
MIITRAYGAMIVVNDNNAGNNTSLCIFSSNVWSGSRRISGSVIITIALMLALIIILIKKLHFPSTWNTVFMVITWIIMYIVHTHLKLHSQFCRSFVGVVLCLL